MQNKEHKGGSLITNMFSGPIREFKTKKAAEKFVLRLTKGGYVRREFKSYFDMYYDNKKPLFNVYEKEATHDK